MKQKWAFLGHTAFIWSMYFLMTYDFLGIDASGIDARQALFVMMAGSLGMVTFTEGIGSTSWRCMHWWPWVSMRCWVWPRPM